MSATTTTSDKPLRHLSDEEWLAMDEDDAGELVDGALVEEEVPDFAHELIVALLIQVLGAWARPKGGVVVGSDAKYVLRRGRGRKPDVSAFFGGTPPPPRSGPSRRPADVMIEVVSADPRDVRRDRVAKMNEYAAFGVKWYWVVDPQARTYEVFELASEARYVRALGVDGGVVEPPGCPGLALDVDAMWAELDRLGPPEAEDD